MQRGVSAEPESVVLDPRLSGVEVLILLRLISDVLDPPQGYPV